MGQMKRIATILTLTLLACGGRDETDGTGGGAEGGQGGTSTVDECPATGITECIGLDVRTCTAGEDGLVWGDAGPCPGEQSCREGACADPSAEQLAQAQAAEGYLQALVDRSAWHAPLDIDGLATEARTTILQGDGSDRTFKTALRSIHLGYPQGHQGLFDQQCSVEMPPQNHTKLGVCGRPHGSSIVVTYAQPGNPLGLVPGDRVLSAGEDEGEAMLEAAARRPVCGTSSPATSHRRTSAAASFFGTIPEGTTLGVAHVDGRRDTLVVPAGSGFVSCQDPLGRTIDFNAQAYVRPDGVAVVRLPRFYPLDYVLPSNPTTADIDALIQTMQRAVLDAFDPVKNAPAIIWDARSNYGGVTPVGLAIVGGMPSAQSMPVSSCRSRIEGTDPPQFSSFTYAEYAVEAGGPFTYSGGVAILIDGLDYSAADYFPFAARAAAPSTLLVGTSTAGAYGGQGPQISVDGPPLLSATIDPNRCEDTFGVPLEGLAIAPDLEVEYEPADLAAGIDTVMEAAASALLAN